MDIEELLERYKSSVYGLALVKTGSKADAEDVFQEVFLALLRSGKKFRDEEHRKAWLLRTTVNQCRRITSSTWRRKTVPLEEAREGETELFPDGEERLLWDAVTGLPEELRTPIYLHYFQGLTAEEAGRALGLTSGAVRMRLMRGRERLRETLKGDDFDDD